MNYAIVFLINLDAFTSSLTILVPNEENFKLYDDCN